MMKIPFFNLQSQHNHLTEDILARTAQMLEEGDFVLGQAVKELEKAFAQYIGSRHAIALGSGTDSLLLSLRSLDVMPGDDVIIPAYGHIAIPEVVARLFANPIFVDIDPNTYGIDPINLQASLTDRTRAIVVSHLYGNPCAIDQVHQFADANGLPVIEDVSQALGSRFMGKRLGTFGTVGCFNFYPTNNLGGAGDGGMVVTDKDDIAERILRLRDHGRIEGQRFDEVGNCSRMDSFQAIVLKQKLEELDESNADRIENARLHDALLAESDVKLPRFSDDGSHVFCLYTIEHDERDKLQVFLEDKGIGARVYYPLPHHLQTCFEYLELGPGLFHVAEMVSKRVLSLPIYPGLKKREIEEVATAVLEYFSVTE